jgi:type II secretory pathway pseudopilin PulG
MKNKQNQHWYSRGSSLLEVLIAIVILSVALLATARLHAMVLQSGNFSKARGVAANLAQEKLEDLQAFSALADKSAADAVDDCAAPVYCFAEMASGTGGSETAAGALALPSGSWAIGNATYTRTWAIIDYYACDIDAVPQLANCAGASAKPYPDFKAAKVTVSWTDEKGAAQATVLQSIIYAADPAAQGRALAADAGNGLPGISHAPGAVPDAVPVPVNTAGNKMKESSKPVPVVRASDTGAEVSFDAVTYSKPSSGTPRALQKEEFVTAACECKFEGTGAGYAPSRTTWDGTALGSAIGDQISKPVGSAANGQSDHCDACCKDHHDVAGDAQPKYDPDRPTAGYGGNGDHKHYWYSACTTGSSGDTSGCSASKKDLAAEGNGYAEVSAGAYLESCRFKRVDGIWRLWQDWRQVKMTVVPYDYLQSAGNLAAYVAVIGASVENAIRTDSGNGTTAIPTLAGRDVTFTAPGQVIQLLARAVYVDRVYRADSPTVADAAYYAKVLAVLNAKGAWLDIVPFYEANLTLLTDWLSASPSTATVASQPIVDINDVSNGYYSSYSRGKATAVAAGTTTVTASARRHNTGVTGGINPTSPSYGISEYDNTGALSDSISVTVSSAPSGVGISGKVIRANTSASFSALQLQIAGATCTRQAALGNEMSYACTVAEGSHTTLAYSTTATGYQLTPVSQAFGAVTVARVAENVTVYGPTVMISGSVTSSSGGKLSGVSGTGGMSCSVAASGHTYTCSVPRGSGYTGTITFTGNNPAPATRSFTKQQADIVQDVHTAK